MQRRVVFWILLGIVLIGVALRSYQLTFRSLWFDEAFSWRLVEFPWKEIISRTAADVHPPLYYFVLKGWSLVFGDSVLALRSFSVACAAAAIILAYCFAASAWGRRAGLLAASFMALSAWQIPYAWEARMYMLGVALTLLSSWLLLKAAQTSFVWSWAGYTVIITAFLYVHNFAAFIFLAQLIWVIGIILGRTKGRFGEIISEKSTWAAVGSFAAVGVLYFPWLPVLVKQTHEIQQSFWIPELTRWSLVDALYRFVWPTNLPLAHAGFGLLLTFLPTICLGALMLLLLVPRARRDAAWLTVLCFVFPLLGAVAISLLGQSILQERYLIFAQAWIFIALAGLISRISWTRLRVTSVSLVLIFLGAAVAHYIQELQIPNHPGLQAAAKELASSRKESEPIFVTSPFIFLPYTFYAGKDFGAPDSSKLVNETKELVSFAGRPVILPEEIILFDEMVKTEASSIWVLDTTGFDGKEYSLAPQWKRQERRTYSELHTYQGEVIVSRWVR